MAYGLFLFHTKLHYIFPFFPLSHFNGRNPLKQSCNRCRFRFSTVSVVHKFINTYMYVYRLFSGVVVVVVIDSVIFVVAITNIVLIHPRGYRFTSLFPFRFLTHSHFFITISFMFVGGWTHDRHTHIGTHRIYRIQLNRPKVVISIVEINFASSLLNPNLWI